MNIVFGGGRSVDAAYGAIGGGCAGDLRFTAGDRSESLRRLAAFESPKTPDLVLPTHELSVEQSVERIMRLLKERGVTR